MVLHLAISSLKTYVIIINDNDNNKKLTFLSADNFYGNSGPWWSIEAIKNNNTITLVGNDIFSTVFTLHEAVGIFYFTLPARFGFKKSEKHTHINIIAMFSVGTHLAFICLHH